MARTDEQDVNLKPLDIEISVGRDDLQRGVKLGVDGEPFWRLHLTAEGEILVGDGVTYPLESLAEILAPEPAAAAPAIQFSKPTHGSTRSSTTLGSLNNVWSDTVTTTEAFPAVRYSIDVSCQADADTVMYVGLARGGVLLDRCNVYNAGSGARQNRGYLGGVDVPGAAGAYTYEVYVAVNSGSLTVASTVTSDLAASLTADGVSSMQLQAVAIG